MANVSDIILGHHIAHNNAVMSFPYNIIVIVAAKESQNPTSYTRDRGSMIMSIIPIKKSIAMLDIFEVYSSHIYHIIPISVALITGISHHTSVPYSPIKILIMLILQNLPIGIYLIIPLRNIITNAILDPLTTRICVSPAF